MTKTGAKMKSPVAGFTLVEVVLTLLVSSVLVIGLLLLLSFNFTYQNQQELRASAMDVLGKEMEKLKRKFIFITEPYTATITDSRTPENPYDDTTATVTAQLFNRNNVELTSPPTDKDRYRVVMTARWYGRGRLGRVLYTERLVAFIIP